MNNVIIVFQKFLALRKDKLFLFSVIGILKTFHFDLHFLSGTLAGIGFLKINIAPLN